MQYLTDPMHFKLHSPSVISLGKFDGLHLGHQKLLHKMRELSKNGETTVVFTFSVPPMTAITSQMQRVLTTNEERRLLLAREGMDYLLECPFTPEIMKMDPERFVREILVERLKARELVVGSDFRFGYQRAGDCRLLERLSGYFGYRLHVIHKEQYEGKDISSTAVREEVRRGNMEKAARMLGRPYLILGTVEHGRHMGSTTFEIPTVNLIPPANKLLPPNGVYASLTRVEPGEFPGVTNIGFKPTVGAEPRPGVETFLFDFKGDLYEKTIEVSLLAYERPEKKFASVEELKRQMHQDIQFGKNYFYQNMNKM